MSDTSLLFNLLGRDNVSRVFAKVRREAVETAAVMDNVGETTATGARFAAVGIGGLAAAASASSLAVGGALAGVPALFAGIGIAAAAQSQQVKTAFTALGTTVKGGLQQAAAPLVPMLQGVAQTLGATFGDIQPMLAQGFAVVAPFD